MFATMFALMRHDELVRTAGFEPAPPEWRSGTLPLSHVRVSIFRRSGHRLAVRKCVEFEMVRPRGFEPLVDDLPVS